MLYNTDRPLTDVVHSLPVPFGYYMGGHGDPIPYNFTAVVLDLHTDGTVTWRIPDGKPQ